jgi:HAD superfamily hydrolase (TIGR01484 family)
MASQVALIASDIDGTLLDGAGQLPAANARALHAAHERGVRLALASVRKRDSTSHIARLIGAPCLLITQGGAAIYNLDGALLYEALLPLPLAREIAAFADQAGLPLMATVEEHNYYLPDSHPSIDMRYISGSDVANLRASITKPPSRLVMRGQAAFEALYAVRHYRADGTLYDAVITSPEATKAGALAKVCAHYGIAPAQVLALGDAESDIGMLQLAGIGVAVANAQPEVRAVADWTAPPAHEAGVAAAVEKFVLFPSP